MSKGVSLDVFVRAWQSSASVEEVMQKVRPHGLKSAIWCRVKACELRKKGVDLKLMGRVDVWSLNKIVDKTPQPKIRRRRKP